MKKYLHKKYPSLSVIVPTYNSAATLGDLLRSIRRQDYPQNEIEILCCDGGSIDSTYEIVRKYDGKLIPIKSIHQGPEYNRAVGSHKAVNELLLFLDHDNELPHIGWMKKMVLPIQDDKSVVGVETLRYSYNSKDSLLGRYFSLFGVNDPVPFALGKADRLAYCYRSVSEYGVFRSSNVTERKSYVLVDFDKDAIPTLGSNGFLIRRNVLFKYAKTDLLHFFHIDVNVDLIRKGFNRYAFIKDTVLHKTDERGLFSFLYRRILFVEKYHIAGSGIYMKTARRYSVFEKRDTTKLLMFVCSSLFPLYPLFISIRGYRIIPDIAWFLHPIMCFGITIAYGMSFIRHTIINYAKKFLE